MEKKPYVKPVVEKIEFDYREQIVASSDLNRGDCCDRQHDRWSDHWGKHNH